MILGLQVVMIALLADQPPLGIMGIVFGAGVGVILWFRERIPAPAGGRYAAGAAAAERSADRSLDRW